MVGVGHLQPAVIGFELARDEALGAHRQQALEIGRIGIEIDELEGGARCILDQDLVGRARAAPSAARPVLAHRHLERGKLADLRVGNTLS